MRLKQILQAVYPDQADFDQAWSAVQELLLEQPHETPSSYPAVDRWIGHRQFTALLDGVDRHSLSVSIDQANDVSLYCGGVGMTDKMRSYSFLAKSAEEAYTGFEFDKW